MYIKKELLEDIKSGKFSVCDLSDLRETLIMPVVDKGCFYQGTKNGEYWKDVKDVINQLFAMLDEEMRKIQREEGMKNLNMDNIKSIKIEFSLEEIQNMANDILARDLTEDELYNLQKRVNYSYDLFEEIVWCCIDGLPEWINL